MIRYLTAMTIFLGTALVHAEDATQFRGNGGTGVSKEKNLPARWISFTGRFFSTNWTVTENLRWKASLPGRGLSNPVIAGGRVYVTATAAYEQKREVVLCFDVKTGKKLWERQVWATGTTLCHKKTNMAAPTPATDGERVYALFATGDVVCYDRDGDLVWYRSLVSDYPTVGNNVGMAASPTIWKELILISMENAGESFAVAIDKRTGENRWRIERPRGINWVSPIVLENGTQADVLFQGPTGIEAHDPYTGKKRWRAAELRHAGYASVTVGDGVVYAPSKNFTAIRPIAGKSEPEVLWQSLKLRPSYCSPVAHGGFVYVVNGNGVVNCADAKTGEIVWTHRVDGPFTASPLVADGKLFLVNEAGVTTVMQTGKEAKVLATNPISDTIIATPVAADGAIFLRSDGMLYCISVK